MNKTGYILITTVGLLALGGGIYLLLRNKRKNNSNQTLPPADVPMGNNLDTNNTSKPNTTQTKYKYVTPPTTDYTNVDLYSHKNFPLKRGSGGEMVKKVQIFLNNAGANLVVDGKFGPKTEAAWKKWQLETNTKLGIEATGMIGTVTEFVYSTHILMNDKTQIAYNQTIEKNI
jgi:peptidoglycan hydrolase-like protein with peptidoglycan-binding domain